MSDIGAFPWTSLKHYFLFSLTVYFEQHYFCEETKEAMKNKTFGLYFSNQKHFDLTFFFLSLNIFPFMCILFFIVKAGSWIVNCVLPPNNPSYSPMHLLSVCMNGSLSNWCTMLHYTPQWGSMQVPIGCWSLMPQLSS